MLRRHVVSVTILQETKSGVQNFLQVWRWANIDTPFDTKLSSMCLNEAIFSLHSRWYSFPNSINITEVLLMLHLWIYLQVEINVFMCSHTSQRSIVTFRMSISVKSRETKWELFSNLCLKEDTWLVIFVVGGGFCYLFVCLFVHFFKYVITIFQFCCSINCF